MTHSLILSLPDSSFTFISTFVSPSDYHFNLSNPTSAVEHLTGSKLWSQPKQLVSSKLKGEQDLTSRHQAGAHYINSALQGGARIVTATADFLHPVSISNLTVANLQST